MLFVGSKQTTDQNNSYVCLTTRNEPSGKTIVCGRMQNDRNSSNYIGAGTHRTGEQKKEELLAMTFIRGRVPITILVHFLTKQAVGAPGAAFFSRRPWEMYSRVYWLKTKKVTQQQRTTNARSTRARGGLF